MFLNVRPKQIKSIPWGWKNTISESTETPIVVAHPGKITMPGLMDFFEWDSWEITNRGHASSLGTKDMKSIFTTAIRFIGWENIHDELNSKESKIPDITNEFLKWNWKLLESFRGSVSWFMIGDDLADNNGMMIDPNIWESKIRPETKKLVELADSYNCRVIFHSDGDISSILDSIIELGISVVNYQPVGGMNKFLYKKYYRSVEMMINVAPMKYEGYAP